MGLGGGFFIPLSIDNNCRSEVYYKTHASRTFPFYSRSNFTYQYKILVYMQDKSIFRSTYKKWHRKQIESGVWGWGGAIHIKILDRQKRSLVVGIKFS